MGVFDRAKYCLQNPGGCLKGPDQSPPPQETYQGRSSRDIAASTPPAHASVSYRVGRTASSVADKGVRSAQGAYQGGKSKAKDLFSCPPGSECARSRKEAKDAERYGVKYPANGDYASKKAARDEYLKAKNEEADQNRALRKMQQEQYEASLTGRTARAAENVVHDTSEMTQNFARGASRVAKVNYGGSVTPAPRGRGRPKGSGLGHYSPRGGGGYAAPKRKMGDIMDNLDDEFSGLF